MFRDKRSAATLSALMNAEQMEQLQEQFIKFIEQQKKRIAQVLAVIHGYGEPSTAFCSSKSGR